MADSDFKDYTVYVPADEVEVKGVMHLDVATDIRYLCEDTVGAFKIPNMGKINVLEIYRLTKAGTKDPINKVKITFEGKVLPGHIIVDKSLLIPIRPFYPKPLFCDKCLDYRHSSAYCTKFVEKCRKCGENHKVQNCTTENEKCFHCKESHIAGSSACSTKRRVERKVRDETNVKLFNSYQALLSISENDQDDENDNSDDTEESTKELTCHINQFGKRKRLSSKKNPQPKRSTLSYADIVIQHSTSKTAQNSQGDTHPVHGRKQENRKSKSTGNHTTTYTMVENIIRNMELPEFVKVLLVKLLPPLIDSLWTQFSESLTQGLRESTNI